MIEYLRKSFIHCVYFVQKSVKFTVKYSTFFISNSVWKYMNNVIALITCHHYERTSIYCSKVIFSLQFFTKPGLDWPLVLNAVNITSTYALSFEYFEDHCRDSRIWCSTGIHISVWSLYVSEYSKPCSSHAFGSWMHKHTDNY